MPDIWFEDRDDEGNRFGHRDAAPHPEPGGEDFYFDFTDAGGVGDPNQESGCGYWGVDYARSDQGGIWIFKFQLLIRVKMYLRQLAQFIYSQLE
jgi:hypothetical protein